MMTRILTRGYLWLLLALLYSPILIIMGSYIPPDPKPGGYNLCL